MITEQIPPVNYTGDEVQVRKPGLRRPVAHTGQVA
jgi:hypothetical protein